MTFQSVFIVLTIAAAVIIAALLLTYLGAPVCFGDWRKTGARLAHFWAGFLRQSAPVLGNPFRGSRLAQLAQPAIVAKNDDGDWRNETGANFNHEEQHMTEDERNDRREGYADGLAGKRQCARSQDYDDAQRAGFYDEMMMAFVTEHKRRAALPVPA